VGRVLGHRHIPPAGLAAISGAAMALLAERLTPTPIAWNWPAPTLAEIQLTPAAFFAVSVPAALFSLSSGYLRGLSFLSAQGYHVPADRLAVTVGLTSVATAAFGGHVATVSADGLAVLGGLEAGPKRGRYWAVLIAAILMLFIALVASSAASATATPGGAGRPGDSVGCTKRAGEGVRRLTALWRAGSLRCGSLALRARWHQLSLLGTRRWSVSFGAR
jgi:benzoate membrane transport protein